MMNKVILAGGSGYLGTLLADYFSKRAKDVIVLTRGASKSYGNIRFIKWDAINPGSWIGELENADLLINLAGKNVNCRYTAENKTEIYQSRILSTRVLGEAFLNCKTPPRVWINASSATIYVDSRDQMMTESTGIIGNDFSMDVCKKWESEFNRFKLPRTRKIIARISIVLGKGGGALPPMINLVRVGMGGPQGDGKQFMSWTHEKDICRAMEWFYKNEKAMGIYNLTAPTPIPNINFMKHLRRALGVRWGLPLTHTVLKIGAVLIRTETELVLKSRKVYPERLLNEGFVFEFNDPKEALEDLCRQEM
jgi:uncharacterized protein (TIGR01777 family)